MNTTTIADLAIIPFEQHSGPEGCLTVIPCPGNGMLNMTVRRIFTISNVPAGGVRGDHAHKDCIQVVVCLHGSVTIVVDDGTAHSTFILNDASKGLFIPPGLWNHLTFAGPETMIVVLCDQDYDNDEYLRDRASYRAYKGL
jgi:dTDP-4-dehydrorhamnose 3,5-epimerase-like enzyme